MYMYFRDTMMVLKTVNVPSLERVIPSLKQKSVRFKWSVRFVHKMFKKRNGILVMQNYLLWNDKL